MDLGNELDRTALHEAGHFFMNCYYGIEIERASIEPNPQKNTYGGVRTRDTIDIDNIDATNKSPEYIEELKKRIAISFSGRAALKVFNVNNFEEGFDSDKAKASKIINHICNSAVEAVKLYIDIEIETDKIIRENLSKIECIAEELLEKRTLEGKLIENFVEKRLQSL